MCALAGKLGTSAWEVPGNGTGGGGIIDWAGAWQGLGRDGKACGSMFFPDAAQRMMERKAVALPQETQHLLAELRATPSCNSSHARLETKQLLPWCPEPHRKPAALH